MLIEGMGRGSLGGSLVPLPLRLANLRYAPVLRPSFTRIGYGEDMTGEPEVDAINFIIRDTKWIL